MESPHSSPMTIDANIVIAYLNGDERVINILTQWREEGRPLFLSTVAESEVLSFSSWTPEERHATEEFLEENFTSIAFDRMISRVAAKIRRETKVKFPDAAIAATALFTHTAIVTRNRRDFKHISGLDMVTF